MCSHRMTTKGNKKAQSWTTHSWEDQTDDPESIWESPSESLFIPSAILDLDGKIAVSIITVLQCSFLDHNPVKITPSNAEL